MRKASSFRNNQKRVSVLIAKREGSCKRAAKSCRIGTVHMVINRKSATPRKSPWNQNFCQGGRRRLDVFRANVLVPYCFITQSKVIASFEPANHAKWSLSLKIVMIRLHLCLVVSNITVLPIEEKTNVTVCCVPLILLAKLLGARQFRVLFSLRALRLHLI